MMNGSLTLATFVLLFLVENIVAHGTVTFPAMRENLSVSGGWCPWCQGSQEFCDPTAKKKCTPPTPCWGAEVNSRVPSSKFGNLLPPGNDWIESPSNEPPLWCPGKEIPIKYYINADHNGVYRWEVSSAKDPTVVTEESFHNFTDWRSINNDENTLYFSSDGKTPLKKGICNSGKEWTPETPHCRDNDFAKTSFVLPAIIEPGLKTFRWLWYGAMTTNQKRVTGPEHSLFVNCIDVKVGTEEECKKVKVDNSCTKCQSKCSEKKEVWNGSFSNFVGNTDFCSDCSKFGQGNSCSYICAGGRPSGSGSSCELEACESGQYTFTEEGWNIKISPDDAKGKIPYRSFAYLPFCHGTEINKCTDIDGNDGLTFQFTFKLTDFEKSGSYVKLLFWTDNGNLLGLLPGNAPASKSKTETKLLFFPNDDYPNQWKGEMNIKDNQLYNAMVTVKKNTVTINVDGMEMTKKMDIDFSADRNGPQLGVYSFDYASTLNEMFQLTVGEVKLEKNTNCTCEEECRFVEK